MPFQGGVAFTKNLKQRLERDIQSVCPDNTKINITIVSEKGKIGNSIVMGHKK